MLCACSPGNGDATGAGGAGAQSAGGAAAQGGAGGGFGSAGGNQGAGGEGGACVADELAAELVKSPIDIIMMVDTSFSMQPAMDSVKAQLEGNFVDILEQSQIDYRVILIAGWGPTAQLTMCVEPPLGGAACNPLPAVPANTAKFFQYPRSLGSGLLPGELLDYFNAPDPLNVAPNGWSQWLRDDAFKVFVTISDTSSTSSDTSLGDAFDATLLAFDPPVFGVPGERRYVYHSIIGLQAKPTPDEAHLATDPIVGAACTGYPGGVGPGEAVQRVSVLSGGLRFPMCEFASFSVVFDEIAVGITEYAVACEFPFPDPPGGQDIDPATVQVELTPEGSSTPDTLARVDSAAECVAGAFYIASETVHLCPETCEAIKQAGGSLSFVFGCALGPAR